ncbi:MAG: type II toxin-antitoxin system prevent-host-death family antitoxin [Clostridia bacterium]|nr:type II toxin-antitoxin system prevent-host-death family antitoxin [Clostridia bacterium]
MPMIRPCADLRNNYNDISRICHETKEPVFITKNGSSDVVILSNETYEKLKEQYNKTEEERIDKLLSERFDKYYSDFEDFQKEVFAKIDKALEDVENGHFQSLNSFCAETEEKYDFK